VSLVPADAVGGIRADVEARVAALRPAFLRWPGWQRRLRTTHWTWGIGPRGRAPVWVNLSWKNEPEPGDVGNGRVRRLLRRVGAEPSITVNVEGRGATVEEAAGLGRVLQRARELDVRRAARRERALRAVRRAPLEIGNEIWGDWVRGHSDATTYAANYLRYARAMKAKDPKIELDRGRRQRHGLEPHAAAAAGARSTTWRSTTTTATRRWRATRQPDGAAAALRALLRGGRGADPRGGARPADPLSINEWGLSISEARYYSMEGATLRRAAHERLRALDRTSRCPPSPTS
jgi:hypothetical protein